MKRLSMLAMFTLALAAAAIPALAANKRKPVAYYYTQCKTKTNCSYTGNTNVKGTSLTMFPSKICSSAQNVIGQIGAMKVSHGKFSKTVNSSVSDPKTRTTVPLKAVLKGTLKARKSVTGTVTVTTSASDCAAISGKAQHFNMKYKGPIYGG